MLRIAIIHCEKLGIFSHSDLTQKKNYFGEFKVPKMAFYNSFGGSDYTHLGKLGISKGLRLSQIKCWSIQKCQNGLF